MKKKTTTKTARAPQGGLVQETPEAGGSGPLGLFHTPAFLGDVHTRYGTRLLLARQVPMAQRLEMLTDPIIAFAHGWVQATLVRAKRVVECPDQSKQAFFEAMFRSWEREFMLQASQAVALGGVGLIKKYRFQTPSPVEVGAPPVWTSRAIPYIVVGFEQVDPVGSYPTFDGGVFSGVHTRWGDVDRFFSAWLTIGKARAFGDWMGMGRYMYAYPDWWAFKFLRDQLITWVQKNVDRIAKVRFPTGETNGKKNKEIAHEIGDDARSGATVVLPSTVWDTTDPLTQERKLTSTPKWDVEFMPGSDAAGILDAERHLSGRIALSWLVPYQMFTQVEQSSLGGPTTAEVLAELAESILMMDAVEIDRMVTEDVFRPVDVINFPTGTPPVQLRTVGLQPDDRGALLDVMRAIAGSPDAAGLVSGLVDMRELLSRLGVPTTVAEDVSAMAASSVSSGDVPSDEVLRRIAGEHLTPVPQALSVGLPEDESELLVRLHEVFPEVFPDADDWEVRE